MTVLTTVNPDMARDLETAGVTNVEGLARSSPDALVASPNAAGVAIVDAEAVTRAVTAVRIARSFRIGG